MCHNLLEQCIVRTAYSIHYTKLYEAALGLGHVLFDPIERGLGECALDRGLQLAPHHVGLLQMRARVQQRQGSAAAALALAAAPAAAQTAYPMLMSLHPVAAERGLV